MPPERDWVTDPDFDLAMADFSISNQGVPTYRDQFRDCYDAAGMYAWLSGRLRRLPNDGRAGLAPSASQVARRPLWRSLRACWAGRSRPRPLRYPILASSAGGPKAATETTTELKATEATQALAAGRLLETLALSTSNAHAPNTSPTAMPVNTNWVPEVTALHGARREQVDGSVEDLRGGYYSKIAGVCEVGDREKEPARGERVRYTEAEAEGEPPPRGQRLPSGGEEPVTVNDVADGRRHGHAAYSASGGGEHVRRSPDMLGLDVDRYPGQEIDKYYGGAHGGAQ